MGKSKTGAREADLDTYPPNPQTSRHHRPAFRDSVLDDDFCHAGRGHLAAGDATRHFASVLIPLFEASTNPGCACAGLLGPVVWCGCLFRLPHPA